MPRYLERCQVRPRPSSNVNELFLIVVILLLRENLETEIVDGFIAITVQFAVFVTKRDRLSAIVSPPEDEEKRSFVIKMRRLLSIAI